MYMLLLAAGRGRRFSTERPKQFTALAGRPVFVHSLEVLQTSPAVEGIGLVIPEGCRGLVEDLIERSGLKEPDWIGTGGETRRQSVREGLGELDGNRYPVVGIHDAARPNLSVELVRDLVVEFDRLSGEAAAVVPGVHPVDTVKRIRGDEPDRVGSGVEETLDRSELRLIQTPQIFSTAVLREVHETWPSDRSVSDDASMLEETGHRVRVIPGSRTNHKLTYPEDRDRLEWLLREGSSDDE